MSDLFIGMWVDVDAEIRTGTRNSEGGRGRITHLNDNSVSVKYLLTNLSSPAVKHSRIHSADLILSGRRKSREGTTTPSLLSHLYGEYRSQQLLQSQQEETTVVNLTPRGQPVISTGLLLNMMLEKNNVGEVVKIIKENNQSKGKGWLRENEAKLINSNLQQKSKQLLLI